MPDAQTIYNDKFERGSAYSLYLAREYLPKEGPFLFLHGDLLYHERLLHECAQAEGTCLVVGPRQECSDEEIVIKANDKEKVIKMKRGGTGGLEWRGIMRVAPEDRTELINVLRQDVSRSLDAPLWKSVRTFCYNSSVRILYSDAPWIEIDSLDDFREAREKIWPLIQNEEE
jgi:choline kinase